MLEVIRALYIFHQHIVDIYLHGTSDQIFKDFINHSLEGSPRVFESEGHHLIAVDPRPVVKAVFSSSDGCILI